MQLEDKFRLYIGAMLVGMLILNFYWSSEHQRREVMKGIEERASLICRLKVTGPRQSGSAGLSLLPDNSGEEKSAQVEGYLYWEISLEGPDELHPDDREMLKRMSTGRPEDSFTVLKGTRLTYHRYLANRDMGVSFSEGEGDGCWGMQKVVMDISGEQSGLERFKLRLLVGSVSGLLVALVLLYILIKILITKPLAHLKEVSDNVRRGGLDVRAKLATGDELEGFARTFNLGLDYIERSQKKLSAMNRERDKKLKELGRANLELYEMSRLQSEFLANVTHELKTPLNTIVGFTEILQERYADKMDDKSKRYLTNIESAAGQLVELIDNIIDLAHLEAGSMEVHCERFDLEVLVREVASPFVEVHTPRIRFLLPDPEVPIEITGDRRKIYRVIYNLLSNACKFIADGGEVVMKLTGAVDGRVLIEVSDTGVGIHPDDQKIIFERFRQADGSITRGYEGSGLGLSIVKELVELLEGKVWVESSPGEGARFFVELPEDYSRNEKE